MTLWNTHEVTNNLLQYHVYVHSYKLVNATAPSLHLAILTHCIGNKADAGNTCYIIETNVLKSQYLSLSYSNFLSLSKLFYFTHRVWAFWLNLFCKYLKIIIWKRDSEMILILWVCADLNTDMLKRKLQLM